MKVYAIGNRPQKEMTASPESYPQGYFNKKPCRDCGNEFEPNAPSHLYCSQVCTDRAIDRRYLERKYNLTLEHYHHLFEVQNGKCAICQTEGFAMHPNQRMKIVVDHCHKTGKVRGLLCHNCNRALGLMQDNPSYFKRAIDYLEGATTIPEREYTLSERKWKRTTRGSRKSS